MGGIGSGGARRKATDGIRAQISARIPSWLVDLIKDEAAHRRVSTSQLITDYLMKGVEK